MYFFFTKEDYLNYSMVKESLLAYLLDKYPLYRTLTINITFKCFYCKTNKLLSSQQQLQNFNESFFNWQIAIISVFSSSH